MVAHENFLTTKYFQTTVNQTAMVAGGYKSLVR